MLNRKAYIYVFNKYCRKQIARTRKENPNMQSLNHLISEVKTESLISETSNSTELKQEVDIKSESTNFNDTQVQYENTCSHSDSINIFKIETDNEIGSNSELFSDSDDDFTKNDIEFLSDEISDTSCNVFSDTQESFSCEESDDNIRHIKAKTSAESFDYFTDDNEKYIIEETADTKPNDISFLEKSLEYKKTTKEQKPIIGKLNPIEESLQLEESNYDQQKDVKVEEMSIEVPIISSQNLAVECW